MATAPISDKYKALFVQAQSSLGETVTMAAGDAVPAWDINWSLRGEPSISRSNQSTGYGGSSLAHVVGAVGWEITFKTELVVPLSAGVVTGWEESQALFEATPVALAVNAGVDIDIDPVSGYVPLTDITPVNIEMHTQDGLKYAAQDCIGTFKLVAEAGSIAYLEWTFHGTWNDVAAASLTAPTYGTSYANPCVFKGATWSDNFSDSALLVTRVEFEPGQVLRESLDGTATNGFALSTVYYEGDPILRWQEPEEDLAGSRDMWAEWYGQDPDQISITFASKLSDSWNLVLPLAGINSITRSTVEGYQAFDFEAYGIHGASGNDQWSIKVT